MLWINLKWKSYDVDIRLSYYIIVNIVWKSYMLSMYIYSTHTMWHSIYYLQHCPKYVYISLIYVYYYILVYCI